MQWEPAGLLGARRERKHSGTFSAHGCVWSPGPRAQLELQVVHWEPAGVLGSHGRVGRRGIASGVNYGIALAAGPWSAHLYVLDGVTGCFCGSDCVLNDFVRRSVIKAVLNVFSNMILGFQNRQVVGFGPKIIPKGGSFCAPDLEALRGRCEPNIGAA